MEGEADLATVPEVQSTIRGMMARKVPHLILDFAAVTFVNTPIWAVVVEYFQHANKSKTGFVLSGLTGRVEASFNIVRLGELVQHYPTLEDALDAYGGN